MLERAVESKPDNQRGGDSPDNKERCRGGESMSVEVKELMCAGEQREEARERE